MFRTYLLVVILGKVYKERVLKVYRRHIIDVILMEFTLTKKIAKHGNQAVITIPKMLQKALPPQTMVEIKIRVLEDTI